MQKHIETREEFTERITADNRLRSRLLEKGERPDHRPWGGHFDVDNVFAPRGKRVVASRFDTASPEDGPLP